MWIVVPFTNTIVDIAAFRRIRMAEAGGKRQAEEREK